MLLNPGGPGQISAAAQIAQTAAAQRGRADVSRRVAAVQQRVAAPKPPQAPRTAAPAAKKPARPAAKAPGKPAAKKGITTPAELVPKFTQDTAYVNQKNDNGLDLDDYDAQRALGLQQAQGNQRYQSGLLKLALGDQHDATAEDFAGRGIIRSGAYGHAQDLVDASGVQQQAAIDQPVNDYQVDTTNGRLALQGEGRTALDKVLTGLQTAFYSTQKKAK